MDSLARRAVRLAAGIMLVAMTFHAGAAAADTLSAQFASRQFPAMQVFTFLFLMLGPIKIIGPFAAMTRNADTALTRRIARRGATYASIALLLAAMLGENMLRQYGIPVPVLALSAGIILLLVALINVLQQFLPVERHDDAAPGPPPGLGIAMSPLAFPTIVTPYGIAVLVVFMALSPDLASRMKVGAILLAIMGLNVIAMVSAKRILPFLGIALPIFGAVLGVIQVALGLQIIQASLRLMWAP